MTTTRIAVITDTGEIDPAPGIALLEEAGYTVHRLETDRADEIIGASPDTDVILAGYAPITAEIIDALPNLRLIATLSMGFDMVDVEHASERGIWVSNVMGAATTEVAEHALALALDRVRGISRFASTVTDGGWALDAAPTPRTASELRCSVLGYGRIGRAFVALARGVFGEVRVHDPFATELTSEDAEAGVKLVSLDDAVAHGDVVSLHLPLTDESRHVLSEERLSQLPAGAIIVNVSRGELIDEDALVRALDSGHLGGAGLDVLVEEPPRKGHPLIGRPDVVVTPHAAFLSARTLREYPRLQAENVLTLDRTGTPLTPVNRPETRD